MTPDFDNHEVCASVDFIYPVDEQAEEPADTNPEAAFWRRFGALKALELIASFDRPKAGGQAAHALLFLLKASPYQSQKQLAARLHISPGRCSQVIKAISVGLDSILAGITAPLSREK